MLLLFLLGYCIYVYMVSTSIGLFAVGTQNYSFFL